MEYKREIEEDEIEVILNGIKFSFFKDSDRVLYMFVYGKHAKSSFKEFQNNENYEVTWTGYFAPGLMKVFAPIIAGYGGLIKIKSVDNLLLIAKRFSHLSMFSFYYFSSQYESELIEYVKINNWRSDPEVIVEKDEGFFSLTIDGDNAESSTGYYLIVSFGSKCPSTIINSIVSVFKESSPNLQL